MLYKWPTVRFLLVILNPTCEFTITVCTMTWEYFQRICTLLRENLYVFKRNPEPLLRVYDNGLYDDLGVVCNITYVCYEKQLLNYCMHLFTGRMEQFSCMECHFFFFFQYCPWPSLEHCRTKCTMYEVQCEVQTSDGLKKVWKWVIYVRWCPSWKPRWCWLLSGGLGECSTDEYWKGRMNAGMALSDSMAP